MAISPYIAKLRESVGNSLLLIPSVTAIIYGERDEILLCLHRGENLWSTPGGAIEPGESPEDAVVREAWEETGLVIKPVSLIGVFGGSEYTIHYANGDETQYVMAVYECVRLSGELVQVNDEVTECRFISEQEFYTLPAGSGTKAFLPSCYARPRSPVIGDVRWTPPDAAN